MTRVLNVPTVLHEHRRLVAGAYEQCESGWYIGTMETLRCYGWGGEIPSRTNPLELWISLRFSRDRMHHSVGWWRNAEYEYCWHLSIGAREAKTMRLLRAGLVPPGPDPGFEDIPELERVYWARLFFGEHVDKVWHEPGGTDPRLTPDERRRHAHLHHLRVFLDPETFEPFIPQGEVYDLTRWIPGLTPEKVDR